MYLLITLAAIAVIVAVVRALRRASRWINEILNDRSN